MTVGVDVVSVQDITERLTCSGTRFTDLFTATERRVARQRAEVTSSIAQHYAARWAAKEAVIKAWSSRHYGQSDPLLHVPWRDIEVVTDHVGRPRVRLHGTVAQHLGDVDIQLSLSHDDAADIAMAFVVMTDV